MGCTQALQTIMDALISARKASAVEGSCLEQAVQHVTQCRQCVESLDTFAALMGVQPSGLLAEVLRVSPCWRYQEALPAYIDREVYGEAQPKDTVELQTHLHACPDCYEDYEALRDMVIAEARGLLGTSLRESASLWEEPSAEAFVSPKGFLSKGLDRVKQLTTQIEALLTKGTTVITTTSPMLRPLCLTPALVMRDRAVPEAEQLIPLPDEEGGIQVNVTLKATDRGQAAVTVEVVDLRSASPIDGALVVLFERAEGTESLLQAENTNELGEVRFSLGTGQYVIQVTHAQHTLRFPLGFERRP